VNHVNGLKFITTFTVLSILSLFLFSCDMINVRDVDYLIVNDVSILNRYNKDVAVTIKVLPSHLTSDSNLPVKPLIYREAIEESITQNHLFTQVKSDASSSSYVLEITIIKSILNLEVIGGKHKQTYCVEAYWRLIDRDLKRAVFEKLVSTKKYNVEASRVDAVRESIRQGLYKLSHHSGTGSDGGELSLVILQIPKNYRHLFSVVSLVDVDTGEINTEVKRFDEGYHCYFVLKPGKYRIGQLERTEHGTFTRTVTRRSYNSYFIIPDNASEIYRLTIDGERFIRTKYTSHLEALLNASIVPVRLHNE
jgi:hypothetical protein